MSNFIWNNTALETAKSNLNPLPGGADPTKWVQASDWNGHRQSLLDIQTALRTPPVNIRNFGALPDDGSLTINASPGIDAAVASMTAPSAMYIPSGHWLLSEPIWLRGNFVELYGDGISTSIVETARGDPTLEPTWVPGFVGSGAVVSGTVPFTPSIVAGPFASTNALNVDGSSGGSLGSAVLSDAPAWGSQVNGMAQLSLQTNVKVLSPSIVALGGNTVLIGSRGGIGSVFSTVTANVAFGVYVTDPGSGPILAVAITTSNNNQVTVTTAFTLGAWHNIEINYNGSFLDAFLDGVSFAHVACTGTITRYPWESATFGTGGSEGARSWASPQFLLGSTRLSNTARHTGTGSFTPPNANYTWDSTTVGLLNWDQATPAVGAPWILGQGRLTTTGGPVPHYIRLVNGKGGNATIHDLEIVGGLGNTLGLEADGNFQSLFYNLNVQSCSSIGILCANPNGFFTQFENVSVSGGSDVGVILYATQARNVAVFGSKIEAWLVTGVFDNLFVQPNNLTQIPILTGVGNTQAQYANIILRGSAIDSENLSSSPMITGVWVGLNTASFSSQGSSYSVLGTTVPPLTLVGTAAAQGFYSQNDIYQSGGATGAIEIAPSTVGPVPGAFLPIVLNGRKVGCTNWSSTVGLVTPLQVQNFLPTLSASKLLTSDGTTPSWGLPYTDASGTPGNATINTMTGRFAIASATSVVTITNSLVSATSRVVVTKETLDTTATDFKTVPGSGSFVVTTNANATAAVKFSFEVFN